jgi:hypothetical protein
VGFVEVLSNPFEQYLLNEAILSPLGQLRQSNPEMTELVGGGNENRDALRMVCFVQQATRKRAEPTVNGRSGVGITRTGGWRRRS